MQQGRERESASRGTKVPAQFAMRKREIASSKETAAYTHAAGGHEKRQRNAFSLSLSSIGERHSIHARAHTFPAYPEKLSLPSFSSTGENVGQRAAHSSQRIGLGSLIFSALKYFELRRISDVVSLRAPLFPFLGRQIPAAIFPEEGRRVHNKPPLLLFPFFS